MQKMSFCNSDQKSMLIGGFLACNDSDIFCRPKLIYIGGLDAELISCLQCLHSIKTLTSNGIPNGGVIPLSVTPISPGYGKGPLWTLGSAGSGIQHKHHQSVGADCKARPITSVLQE